VRQQQLDLSQILPTFFITLTNVSLRKKFRRFLKNSVTGFCFYLNVYYTSYYSMLVFAASAV